MAFLSSALIFAAGRGWSIRKETMMVRNILLAAAVWMLLGTGVAGAVTTLATPPLPGGVDYECSAVNVGTRPIEVNLALHSFNGGSVQNLSCMGLQAGKVCRVFSPPNENHQTYYCLVTIVKGSKRSVRASLVAKNGGVIAAMSPAQ